MCPLCKDINLCSCLLCQWTLKITRDIEREVACDKAEIAKILELQGASKDGKDGKEGKDGKGGKGEKVRC